MYDTVHRALINRNTHTVQYIHIGDTRIPYTSVAVMCAHRFYCALVLQNLHSHSVCTYWGNFYFDRNASCSQILWFAPINAKKSALHAIFARHEAQKYEGPPRSCYSYRTNFCGVALFRFGLYAIHSTLVRTLRSPVTSIQPNQA